jgi:hypothetical protein
VAEEHRHRPRASPVGVTRPELTSYACAPVPSATVIHLPTDLPTSFKTVAKRRPREVA